MNAINSHPYLKGKWVLKGGTALNLFFLDIPRLSVDIDLNYIGFLNREEMLEDRRKIEKSLQAVFSREGFITKKVPEEHAGGKWRLSYPSFTGQSGNLELDMNFMFRLPLWDIHYADTYLGDYQARNIPVLDFHEMAAGKLSALFARKQARDLFDCHRILSLNDIQLHRLRIAFIVYGAMNRKDWRTTSKEDIDFNETELARQLLPTLHRNTWNTQKSSSEYGNLLTKECRQALSAILPFKDEERKFLNLLLDKGEIDPSTLTADEALQQRIKKQPLLEWKALNVKRHKKLS